MMRVAWTPLAVLVFVSVPRLGAEEVKIIGRNFAFDAPAMLSAGTTTFVFEKPGDVRHEMILNSAATRGDGAAHTRGPSGWYYYTETSGAVW